MVKKVDKEKAVALKEQGKTYTEIAAELGCSVDWCKRNLKEVVKNKEGKEMIEKYISQSKSKQAITSGQIKKMLLEDFANDIETMSEVEKEDFVESKTKSIKRKITEAGGVVRPLWMHPKHSKESFQRVLDLVNDFDSRLYDLLEEFKYDMQDITGEDIKYIDLSAMNTLKMLSQLGVGQYGSSRIVSFCEALTSVSDHLHILNKETTTAQHNRGVDNLRENCNQKTCTADFPDLENLMY